MSSQKVYVALQQFCEKDSRPLELMTNAGLDVTLNKLGHRLKAEEMPQELKGMTAVLAGVEPYTKDLFEKLPDLKCLSRCGIGTDSIDLDAASTKKIKILTTVEEVVQPVAELTVAMILALARNLGLHINDFQNGVWKKHTSHLVSDLTIGLVGFGRIARAVESRLRAFGAQILICDPNVKRDDLPLTVEQVDFVTLLKNSDVVSLHAARNPKDGYLMGDDEFSVMKKGSFLVNTARGYMVNEAALQKALEANCLAGAALDVFEEEPYNGPLTKLPQVISTPHVATLTHASRAAMELRAAQNIVDFFKAGKS